MSIYAKLAAMAVIFLAGWTVNGWRYGEQIATIHEEAAEAKTKAVEDALTEERKDRKRVENALNEANLRAQKNADRARALGSDVNGLRDELNSARANMPNATCEATRNYAATCNSILGTMAEAGAGIAAKADGHSSDTMTFNQAWPVH